MAITRGFGASPAARANARSVLVSLLTPFAWFSNGDSVSFISQGSASSRCDRMDVVVDKIAIEAISIDETAGEQQQRREASVCMVVSHREKS